MSIVCAKMTAKRRAHAESLLNEFLRNDPHYLAASKVYGDKGEPALRRAIGLFLHRSELGFVWLAYLKNEPIAVCVVSYAISTSIGGIVAKLDDVFVRAKAQRQGIATQMLRDLIRHLKAKKIRRLDTAVYKQNISAESFYGKLGFETLNEERLALVL
jgi:ribosomal protein S18 acetylase RimI-like enzyme